MKWLFGVFCAALVMAAVPAQAQNRNSYYQQPAEVMSQNLYLGVDLSRLLAGEPPAALLQTVQETDYPARAVEIAEAIDAFNPDVIGLQEVWALTVFDESGNTSLDLDYLDILLAELANQGESYAVGSVSVNADVTLPVSPGVFGRVVDSDVILYRTATTTVSNPTSKHFASQFTVPFGEASLEFTRGYNAVDAHINGQDYRFVNTHLEVAGAPCLTASGPVICQDVQAQELMDDLADETLPVMLVGDFNAAPGTAAYSTIDDAGYLDTWTIRYPYNDEPGYTCCQSEGLNNVENQLTERIDHIFISEAHLTRSTALTTVVGDWDQRKTPSGLWYSDHGGPWARLWLRYGN